jgi:integrase/recombinase XerD
MAKRTKRAETTHERGSFRYWAEEQAKWMRVRNYSSRTLVTWKAVLGWFFDWCEARSLDRPEAVTRPILERYQRHLFLHRKKSGQPLSFGTQKARMIPVKSYFKWLTRQNVLLSNPASEIELPRPEKRLPRHVLTAEEAESVLAMADTSDALGVRDRAILEVLYATGIRRMEVVGLALFDIDFERATALVREGKGKKDRLVPLGERALAWIDKYVREVRDGWLVDANEPHLFLNHLGEPLDSGYLTHRVREYVEAAKLASGKKGACHLFRHTMATLMLEGGADVRFVQEMLGHAKLDTTQIYTRVSIIKLSQIHAATHPGARLRRKDDEEVKRVEAAVATLSTKELLDELAHEDDDEHEEP